MISEELNLPVKFKKLFLGLTQTEWIVLFFTIGLPLSISGLIYGSTSFWMIAGLFFSIFVLLHIGLTNDRYVVFPGFASFIACVQLIIAPYLAYYFPPVSPGFQFGAMAVDKETYFSFATPAVIALWLGLHLPIKKIPLSGHSIAQIRPLNYYERRFMDVLIGFGFLFSVVPIGLGFFAYVLSQVRFVGAISWLLTKTRGWTWRIGFVLLTLFTQILSSGVFYELILWGIFILLAIAYVQKWKLKIFPYILILVLALTSLNNIKPAFRKTISLDQSSYSTLERVDLLSELLVSNFALAFASPLDFSQENRLGDSLVRYNQGWILSRVMNHVPNNQSYGYGETVVSALNDAMLPRFLQPDNPGAHANSINQFKKYTGYRISGVSMGLGILGEAFANFGRAGGILMTLVYGLGVGYIFSKLTWLAISRNILWLAWIPFILLTTLQAEWGFTLILNATMKSIYVAIPLIYFIPFLRRRMLSKADNTFV